MTAPRRSNFLVLGLLALLFFGPMVVATFLYFGGGSPLRPDGSVAHGQLIAAPGRLPDAALPLPDGETLPLTGRWSLIYVDSGECGDDCREGLYRTRQVRRALGKNDLRVQRLFVTLDPARPDPAFLREQHPDLRVVDAQTAVHAEVLGSLGEHGPGDVFVADPLGNVILRFAPGTPMKDIHQDLNLLLKASQIG